MRTKSKEKSKPKRPMILIANGVNLDLLGTREPAIYGLKTLDEVNQSLLVEAERLFKLFNLTAFTFDFFQSNDEKLFLEKLTSRPYHGALINAGAWSHTSLALHDRLKSLNYPIVEVHISNLSRREEIRQKSYLAPLALGIVYGFGTDSYHTALYGLLRHLSLN